MNVVSRGVRNAFRNYTRTISIVVIIGLSIGLGLSMLVARQAVSAKIASVNSSVGNTVTITPAGFNGGSSVNNSLTSTELNKLSSINHVTGIAETLTDRLTTIGSSTPPFPGGNSKSSTAGSTSLTSPITLNTNNNGTGPRLFISGGASLPTNFSLPISIIGTNDPNTVNGTSVTISSGKTISGGSNSDVALISSSMASKNALKVGSTFTAYSGTLTVAGIFTGTSTSALSNDVIVSLPTEQALSGQTGDVTNALASVDSLTNLSAATTAIKNALGSSATVTSSQQQANATVQPLDNIKSITLYSLIGAIIAGAVIIFLIMIMIVRERRREIGVLKAIGASNVKIIWQFMSEAVTLTLLGAVIGIIIGVAAANPITNLLVKDENNSSSTSQTVAFAGRRGGGFASGGGGGFASVSNGNGNFNFRSQATKGSFRGLKNSFNNIQAVVGWSIILYGIGAAIIIAIIGSSAASLLISKVRPSEVMRVE